MKTILYKNEIYPYNLRVILGADKEYIEKSFVNLESDDQGWDGWSDDYGGRTIFVGNKSNHRKEVCLLFKSLNSMDVGTIVHECFHAVSIYCKYLNISFGFDAGEDEHMAYLMGWLVTKTCESYHKWKGKEDGKEK